MPEPRPLSRQNEPEALDLIVLCPGCGLEEIVRGGRHPNEPEVEEELCPDCAGGEGEQ